MNASKLSKVALAVALAIPAVALAESNVTSGAGAISASARLDFRITIPKVLFLAVGTSNLPALTNNATVDLVDFTVPAANLGDGGAIASAPASVTARVVGNGGDVGLTATTTGALTNGSGDTISFAEIVGSSTNANLDHPTFVDGGVSASVPISATGRIVNETATWSFTYANSAVVPEGTYGGVNTLNSRVTYTASLP